MTEEPVVTPSGSENHAAVQCFAYVDTNVISRIAAGGLHDFLAALRDAGVHLVISDVTLQELASGRPKSEFALLEKHSFQAIYAHAALFRHEPATLYMLAEMRAQLSAEGASADTEAFEFFLVNFLRSASGSRSVPNLNELLVDGIKPLLDECLSELPEETDPRLKLAMKKARTTVTAGLNQLPPMPLPLLGRDEWHDAGLGPKRLSNLRPPGIVRQIFDQVPDAERHHFAEALREVHSDDNIRARVQETCIHLTLAGFGRDRRVAKDDEVKSLAGASSQFRDVYHVAAAAGMGAFLTCDGQAAKLAFAAYEFLQLQTLVVHVFDKDGATTLAPVSIDYWP